MQTANTIKFIFFGRLVQEKGADLVLQVLTRLQDELESRQNNFLHKSEFRICGDGVYGEKFAQLSARNPNIKTRNWLPKIELDELLGQCNYALVPSKFLETFGLSALEASAYGLPVLGFAKGGLTRFVLPKFDINSKNLKNKILSDRFYEVLTRVISTFDYNMWKVESENARKIALKYTSKLRYDNFKSKFDAGKLPTRILMVSDYKTIVGGIEKYIYQIKPILEQNGHIVEVVGQDIPHGQTGKLVRYLGLVLSIFNISAAIQIRQKIEKLQPDLIRFHSVSRRIGRFGVMRKANKKITGNLVTWMMYHDLGYFTAFPSEIYEVEQIPTRRNFFEFREKAKIHRQKKLKYDFFILSIMFLAVFCKFIAISLLRKALVSRVDLHLVPSDWMISTIRNLYNIESDKIQVLEHFYDR